MADEPVQMDEVPSGAEGAGPSRSFKLARFSRTSANWVTVRDFQRIDEGQISAPDLLREECRRQGQPPPSEDEIVTFTASLEEIKNDFGDVTVHLVEQLAPKLKLAEQLGLKVVDISPVLGAAFESVHRAQEGLRSIASAARQFDQPQPIPIIKTAGQQTVEALARMQAELSVEEALTNSILEKMASNAQDASREQKHWNRRYFVVALATLACALVALIVGIINLVS